MHRPSRLLFAAFALAFACAAHAAPHRHATAPGSGTASPYAADAALRGSMARVRGAVGAFEHARHGHMGPEQVRALSAHLDAQVARVFAECELEPQADASLHVLLVVILEASRAMRDTPGDFAPVDAMQRAMADYARLFEGAAPGAG